MEIILSKEEAVAIAQILASTVGADAARAFVLLENRVMAAQAQDNG